MVRKNILFIWIRREREEWKEGGLEKGRFGQWKGKKEGGREGQRERERENEDKRQRY